MPYRKKNKKYPPRRKYKGKKGVKKYYKKPSTAIVKGPSGLADKIRVKLRYVTVLNFTTTANKVYQFRGNSLFDPDFTGAGHQPYLYDQWTAMYARYRVFGASIKITAINFSSTMPAQIIVYPAATDNIIANTISESLEVPRAGETKVIPVASRYPVSIKKYISTRAIDALAKNAVDIETEYSATTGASPERLWYWNIVAESMDLTTALDVYLTVKLVYYAQFEEPNIVAQS